MKYLCLIYGAGELGGEATKLRPAAEAATVRVRDGRVQVAEGPFAATPDELAGFQVLEVDGLDEALAQARGIGGAAAVEVRPEYVEEAP